MITVTKGQWFPITIRNISYGGAAFDLQGATEVAASLVSTLGVKSALNFEITAYNEISAVSDGSLSAGKYAIELSCKGADGKAYRMKSPGAVIEVSSSTTSSMGSTSVRVAGDEWELTADVEMHEGQARTYMSLLEEVRQGAVKATEEATEAASAVNAAKAACEEQTAKTEKTNSDITAAESARVEAENGRVNAESERVTAENARVVAENKRAQSEQNRETAEAERVSAEKARVAAEAQRKDAESQRETAFVSAKEACETATKNATAATDKANTAAANANNATAAATSAEKERQEAEDARKVAESARSEEEANRGTAETKRASAETERQSAEDARKVAEQERERTFEAGKEQIQSLVNNFSVVQQTGNSTTSAMSQKAVTDAIQAETARAKAAEQAKLNKTECPIKTVEEPGIYFVDENGNAFMQYDENGFDVEKISKSFKDDINNDEGIKKTSEDGVSIVTDALGNSSVYWDNTHGLDANKVSYNLTKSVKEKYVKNMKEWSNLGIGMFIHWGIYSVLAGHYQGVNIDGQTEDYYSTGIAEWILKLARIPKATYQAYQSQFTAANWDADAVAKMAYDCGMKYIVITVKHHDGFVLYDSNYAPWNLSTSGANGKDPLMELKTACEKYGLKFCTYFSHQKDWTAEGGWDQGWTNGGVDPYTEVQHKTYIENTINVIKEFIKKYDPYILWYDGDSVAPYNSDLYVEQKNYYPQVITNNRLFNTPQKANYACGEGNYFRGSMEQWKYAENCYTTNGSWGYNERYDISEKTINLYNLICKQILESKARSQNALINIGPKGDGAISDLTKTLFGELSDYVVKYGTFDNTRGLNYYTFPNWGRAIIKGRTLRCYVWGGNTSILVDGVYTKYIKSVHVWDIQNPELQDNYQVISDYRLQISNIPVNNDYPSLVDVEFGNDIVFEGYSNIIDDTHHIIDASAFQSNGGCSLMSFSSVPQFGSWTGSGNVSSIFLYNGTSGNHKVKLHIPAQQGGAVTITIKVKDMETDSETTLTATNKSTTTSETVMLTNGHKYRIEVSKTASIWINLSKVEFINQL